MATEILAVPEEHLSDVINIIRAGIRVKDHVDPKAKLLLSIWCDKEQEYLDDSKDEV